ncbi:helix-turn-helix domain-containing protein [Acinetobacter chinensis]|jgi:SOS-response transcriptional repressor LexA|uniref:Helix-turn-helix domain-containing protein n=1 Tax=Acinetobacter chinensis TaxID=2004650 RepID=A0A3B7LW20_9GAMM|nr:MULTISPECIES: S24 family peptidase [Acinetobacter]AXY56611.1 helix-turn-helix domain-containing protein [Acinetobacter chinensis]AXY59997.1 helix-turn-helix domain-containing protein [Acinetobacter sp. WCHAc010052]
MENKTIGQRIRALRRSKKLTQAQLAKIAGVSSPAVTEWEKDSYLPKAASLEAMANEFDVSTEYILTGKGDSPGTSSNVAPVTKRLLPVLSWVQAGSMTSVEEINPVEVAEWLPPLSSDDPEDCFYLKVMGVSNYPTYIEGDYILINPNFSVSDLLSGDLIVVRNNADATFKKLVIESDDRRYLQALNPNFQPNIIEFEDGMELVGLVIDAFRPLGGSRSKRVRKS